MHFVTRPPEEDRFTPVRAELAARRNRELVILVRAAVERALQRPGPDRLGPVLDLEAGVLHRRRIEEERRQAIEVARIEGVAESVENGRSHRGGLLGFRRDQLGAPPVQRGLDRAGRRGERLGDLLERQPEGVFEHDRRSLLRRELGDQRARGLAGRARLSARRRFRYLDAEGGGELSRLPRPVDPQVGGHAKQPRSWVLRRLGHDAEGHERAGHRLLSHVLGIPGAPREMPAVSVEIGAERLVSVEKATP